MLGFALVAGVLFGLFFAVVGLGLNLVFGVMRIVNLAHGDFMMLGAFGAFFAYRLLHWNPLVTIPVLGVAFVLAGIALYYLLVPRLVRLKDFEMIFIVLVYLYLFRTRIGYATLAASEIVYYVIANPALKPITKGPYGIDLSVVYAPEGSYLTMAVIAGIATAIVIYLKRSNLGLSLMAVRDDSISAEMAGINVEAQRIIALIWSALLAGLTGAVYAWQISVFYPGTVFDPSISIFAIVFCLFGGAGTVVGPLLGVVVLYGVYNLIGITEPQYFQLIYGLLIMALVLFLPQGIISLLNRRGVHVL